MLDHTRLLQIPKIQDQTLIFDLEDIHFLTPIEVTELFSHAVLTSGYTSVEVRLAGLAQKYLQQIGFFQALSQIKHVEVREQNQELSPSKEDLLQLQTYTYKPEFYGSYEAIIASLKKIGVSEDMSMLVSSSLGEIIDNAFSHNIGQWSNDIGPLVTALMQNDSQKRELTISICDFGVGFLHTLRNNYPEISTEKEAIQLALKANTTGRPNQRGGNGLLFLQKNIFNGFKGTLSIRSTNTFGNVTDFETFELITERLPFTRGVNVYFSIKY